MICNNQNSLKRKVRLTSYPSFRCEILESLGWCRYVSLCAQLITNDQDIFVLFMAPQGFHSDYGAECLRYKFRHVLYISPSSSGFKFQVYTCRHGRCSKLDNFKKHTVMKSTPIKAFLHFEWGFFSGQLLTHILKDPKSVRKIQFRLHFQPYTPQPLWPFPMRGCLD